MNNEIAYLYALGLIDDKELEKQNIKQTTEFLAEIKKCQLKLIILNSVAPLSKTNKKRLYREISQSLQLNFISRLKKIIKLWHSIVVVILLSIFGTLNINAGIEIVDASDAGWDITMYQYKTLEIIPVDPMVVGPEKICVLWIKNDNKITKIIELPEREIQNIILSSVMSDKLKHGEILISIENKDNISQPSKIEYRRML